MTHQANTAVQADPEYVPTEQEDIWGGRSDNDLVDEVAYKENGDPYYILYKNPVVAESAEETEEGEVAS